MDQSTYQLVKKPFCGYFGNVKNSDYIFGIIVLMHILSLGSPVEKLFAELIGRSTGLSKGYGGSMHLLDMDVGFMGSVPIVAGTVSMAVGAGFAISQRKSESIAIAYLEMEQLKKVFFMSL